VEQDVPRGFALYQQAATNGVGSALNNCGRCYEGKLGTMLDVPRAWECFLEAAEKYSVASAEFRVGQAFMSGELGQDKDIEKAAFWLQRSARQGHSTAQEWVAAGFPDSQAPWSP
jgi:hypothetical protein